MKLFEMRPYGFYAAIVMAFVLLAPFAAGAATYYVDQSRPSASDSNAGTETSPWRTITHAAGVLVAGDTVRVKDGTYARVKLETNSGTLGSPIIFEAHAGHQPVVVDGFRIKSISYIVIRGFKIVPSGSAANGGIRFTGPGLKGMVIDGNHLVDVVGSGILVRGTKPVGGAAPPGYDFRGAVDIVVSNNILERVLNTGFQEIITLSYGVLNCEVFGNTIFDGGKSATGGQGIDLKQGIENCKIHDNEIYNGQKIGIYLDAGNNFIRDVEIYNNYLHDNRGTGIQIGTEGTGGNERINIHHNVVEGQTNIGISVYLHATKGSGEFSDILVEQNTVRDTEKWDISMNHPTSFSTRIINNLIDSDGVRVKRHPDDFFADNNGPWVVIAPLEPVANCLVEVMVDGVSIARFNAVPGLDC